jgi:hypothetical protein
MTATIELASIFFRRLVPVRTSLMGTYGSLEHFLNARGHGDPAFRLRNGVDLIDELLCRNCILAASEILRLEQS